MATSKERPIAALIAVRRAFNRAEAPEPFPRDPAAAALPGLDAWWRDDEHHVAAPCAAVGR